MEKKKYINPCTYVMTIVAERMVATSEFGKGEGNFDPNSMTFVKEDATSTSRDSYNVWDDDWSKN